jgi:phosphoribosylglycinamide formyltransferase-1
VLSLVVLISGSGSNARALLDAAAEPRALFRVIAVGADNSAPGLAHAAEFGIPTFVVPPGDFANRGDWGSALLERINEATAGESEEVLVVCAGFMRILPAHVVHALTPHLINMHPALLPLYPGAHAVADALADGATVTGATVHIVDEGVDTGPVIRQIEVPIEPADTEDSLHERIKQVERELIVAVVNDIARHDITLKEIART